MRLDIGIYSRADAARLLRVTPSRLTRWIAGYSYSWETSHRDQHFGQQPALIARALPALGDTLAMSFVELMELRVVKALVDKGVPLQRIRVASEILSRELGIAHPLASQRVYTDGMSVYAALSQEADQPDFIRLTRRDSEQIISGQIFHSFLSEMDFSAQTSLAERWWPMGKSYPVVLDPRISFGAPTVSGTRIRTRVLAVLSANASVKSLADDYHIPSGAVKAAWEFERHLMAA